PCFMPTLRRDVEKALVREIESDTGIEKIFVPVLYPVVSAFDPIKRENAFYPEVAAFFWIEINLSIRPAGRKTRAVVERRVHLEIPSVVFHLVAECESSRVIAVGHLRRCAVRASG